VPLPGGGVHRALRTASPTSAKPRDVWADAAKGFCVVLVVVWHVVWLHLVVIDWNVPLPAPQAWQAFVNALLPMRMPLFFTISGMFAANAVNRPWSAVARSRIAKFAYLYVLWLLIHQAVVAVVPVPFEERVHSVGDLVEQLTISPTTVWYLFALVVYFVIAKVVRRVPAVPVLVAAFALSAASSAGWLSFLNNHAEAFGNRDAVFQNLVYFLAGICFSAQVRSLGTRTSWPRVALFGLLDAVVLGAMKVFDATRVVGVWPAASIAGVLFGITAVAKLSQWAPLGNALASIGRRTLPIYVVHIPALMVVHWLVTGSALPTASTPVRTLVTIVEPVVLTAALVGFSLALHSLAQRVGAGWLFDLPGGDRKPAAQPVAEPVPVPEARPAPGPEARPAPAAEVESPTVPVAPVPAQRMLEREDAWWSSPTMDPVTRPIPRIVEQRRPVEQRPGTFDVFAEPR
jgi:uncharacterized membrane protein YcfT